MESQVDTNKKNINIFCNPFYIQGLIWSFTVILYSQGWSLLYPPLSDSLKWFFVITIFISFIIGYCCQSFGYFCYCPIQKTLLKRNTLNKALKFLYLIFCLELVVSGIPLFGYILGLNINYTEFGLPIIHVVVVNGFTVICLLAFYAYHSSTNKIVRKYYRKCIVISILPFLLMFNRGGLMICIAGMGLIYLMSCKKPLRKALQIIVATLIISWGFGYLGDLRTDFDGKKHVILDIGQASEDFKRSSIPKEFFWTYLYVTSPLSNLQYTINESPASELSMYNVSRLFLFSMTPELISKRIGSLYEIPTERGLLIVSVLNVSPYLNSGYIYVGWFGMVLMYCFSFFFILVTTSMIPKRSMYYVPIIVSINLIVIMNVFANMFIFMGIVPVPFIIILLNYFKKRLV